ncbi:unnamed protein product [Diplocarpon coronariae]
MTSENLERGDGKGGCTSPLVSSDHVKQMYQNRHDCELGATARRTAVPIPRAGVAGDIEISKAPATRNLSRPALPSIATCAPAEAKMRLPSSSRCCLPPDPVEVRSTAPDILTGKDMDTEAWCGQESMDGTWPSFRQFIARLYKTSHRRIRGLYNRIERSHLIAFRRDSAIMIYTREIPNPAEG